MFLAPITFPYKNDVTNIFNLYNSFQYCCCMRCGALRLGTLAPTFDRKGFPPWRFICIMGYLQVVTGPDDFILSELMINNVTCMYSCI